MARGKKILYQVEQVADEVRRLGERITEIHANPVQIPNLGAEFMPLLRDLDVQQSCGRYVWGGLPPEITSWQIENMLYHRNIAGTIIGGMLYILPYTQTKGVNILGMPVAGHFITYNGAAPQEAEERDLLFGEKDFYFVGSGSQTAYIEEIDGERIVHPATAAILLDRIPFWSPSTAIYSRSVLSTKLLECECDLLARIAINIKNANVKLVFSAQDKQSADVLTRDLSAVYGSQMPFIVVARDNMDSLKNDVFQTKVDLETQALFEAFQSYNSLRCMSLGIDNNGAFEKKERKITGELESNVQTSIVLDNGLATRRLWLAQMKLIFPDYSDMLNKITVDLNQSLQQDEEETEQGEDNEENSSNEEENQ